jgi:hypothetical protein
MPENSATAPLGDTISSLEIAIASYEKIKDRGNLPLILSKIGRNLVIAQRGITSIQENNRATPGRRTNSGIVSVNDSRLNDPARVLKGTFEELALRQGNSGSNFHIMTGVTSDERELAKALCEILRLVHAYLVSINHIEGVQELFKEVGAAIKDMETVLKEEQGSCFYNSGSGPQINNTGTGIQHNNTGEGNQYNAGTMHFSNQSQ